MEQLQRQINGLYCAVNILAGTDGGFTEEEKNNALQVLRELLNSNIEEFRQLQS